MAAEQSALGQALAEDAEPPLRSARPGLAEGRLERIRAMVLTMGDTVDMAIARSMWGLVVRDRALCADVIAEDARVDALRDGVRRAAIELLAGGGVGAECIREALTLVDVAEELERMGDACAEIAAAGRDLCLLPELERPAVALPGLSELCSEQVHDLLVGAVAGHDPQRTAAIVQRAERIGSVLARAVSDLCGLIAADPRAAERAARLCIVAAQLARIAERISRLATDVLTLRSSAVAGGA